MKYSMGMKIKMSDLNKFVPSGMTKYHIARASGLSWPTVSRYLNGEQRHPSIVHIASMLDGAGVDWRNVRLGDLMEKEQD